MSNDKKRRKLIILIVIVLVVINLLVFGILFLDLSKYIWPEVVTTNEITGDTLLADGTFNVDGIIYKLNEDNTLKVISSDKNLTTIDIRETITDSKGNIYNVVTIGEKAFENCQELTIITIPESITKIEDFAFSGCTKLGTITIPYSVKEIGNSLFYDCTNLTSIKVSVANENFKQVSGVLLNTDETILYAYPYKKDEEEYKLSDDLISIEDNVFRGFDSLKTVVCSEKLENIGAGAFENCENLYSVVIFKNVKTIGENAFNGCSEDLVIYGEKDSYAETYAKENNITFKLITEKSSESTTNNTNTIQNIVEIQ